MANVRHQGGNIYRIVLTDDEQSKVSYKATDEEVDFDIVMGWMIEDGFDCLDDSQV